MTNVVDSRCAALSGCLADPIEQQARSTQLAKVRRTRLSKNVFERSELFLRPLEASTADAYPASEVHKRTGFAATGQTGSRSAQMKSSSLRI